MFELNEKGFVFMDDRNHPYWCRLYHGNPWFMYWHENQKSWITYRQATQTDIFQTFQMKISDELAEIYHEQHKKFIDG